MNYVQDPPFSVQVEATEGCNLRCAFCGLNGIRPKRNVREDDRYMTEQTAENIARLISWANWNPRIEFAMHGEPTLNPMLHVLIEQFRYYLPEASILLTTNGDPLRTHELGLPLAVARLFAAGVNTVALDDYRGMRVAPLLRDYAHTHRVPLYEYPDDARGNPHKRQSYRSHRIVIIHDIADNTQGNHAHLSNHAGSAAPLNHSRDKQRCALPFREMSVRWDGNVAICCNDWTGMFKVGNVNKVADIDEIWQHPAMQAARKYLLHRGRVFRPCHGCDHATYRNGLLPDKMGKHTLPAPNADDAVHIERALEGASYTSPVDRPWEKSGAPLRTRVALPVLPVRFI